MIRTKDLLEFMRLRQKEYPTVETWQDYVTEIIARLRAYDRICHDLKLMIATLSSEVDNDAPNPICQKCEHWVGLPVGCTHEDECPENPFII